MKADKETVREITAETVAETLAAIATTEAVIRILNLIWTAQFQRKLL